jgi:WD40 repeat protein
MLSRFRDPLRLTFEGRSNRSERTASGRVQFLRMTGGTAATLALMAALFLTAIEPSSKHATLVIDAREQASAAAAAGCADLILFAVDGKLLAVLDSNGYASLWDPATGLRARTNIGCSEQILSLAFSPDGRLLAKGTSSGTVHLWNCSTLQETNALSDHGRPVRAVAFAPDGRTLASATVDGALTVRATTPGYPELRHITLPCGVNSIAFSPDSRHLAATHVNGEVTICPVTNLSPFFTLTRSAAVCRSVAFSADSRIVAASTFSSDGIRLWDFPSRRERAQLSGTAAGVPVIAFAPAGNILAAAGRDGSLSLWNVDTGRQQRIAEKPGRMIWSLAFSPDGRTLASGDVDQSIKVWDLSPWLSPYRGDVKRPRGGADCLAAAFPVKPRGGWLFPSR